MSLIDDVIKRFGVEKELAEKAVAKAGSMAFTDTIKQGIKNVRNYGFANGEYVEAAIKGAVIWGAVGGVTEWSQGGSFWAGAKSNIISGALMGAGARAFKIGATTSKWQGSSFGDAWKGYKKMHGIKKKENISKALKAVLENKYNEETVKKILKRGGVNL